MAGKVFVSGPIQGMETEQSYRDVIREVCVRCGFEVVDPWERERVLYCGSDLGWWNRVPAADFIERDLEDIRKSDILVAYVPKLSAGTCMELFYAKHLEKKTVCICLIDNPSPWIIVHADIVINELWELEEALKRC